MKKDEANITMEDRQEAKRRIEGSLAPDADHDVSSANSAPRGGMSSLNPANLH
jgi:hypothetical protein